MPDDRPDPLGDVINLLAAPIASGLRSIEQMKRGVDELFRAVENLNRTMENMNAAAERVNRFMADVEEPVRAMLPQLTRTVRAADEMMEIVGGPAKRVAPNLARLADTLGSPAFTGLPHQLTEFMNVMSDMSRRLGPLAQFAESAGGMFGLRLPGMPRPAEPTPASPVAAAAEMAGAAAVAGGGRVRVKKIPPGPAATPGATRGPAKVTKATKQSTNKSASKPAKKAAKKSS